MVRLFFVFLTICFCIAPATLCAQQLHHNNQDLPCVNKNYNILAHVAVDSINRVPLYKTEDLDTMIMKLNEFFRPICVSFSLCEFNVLENDYSLGTVINQPLTIEEQLLELKTRFTLRRRINIYFLEYIDNIHCGTSTFNGILTDLNANIYTERDCPDEIAGQVAHHLGHTFGLLNTYDPLTIEHVNGDNCTTTGDFLCDTPADPYGQSILNATPEEIELVEQGLLQDEFFNGDACEFIYEIKDPNGQYYQPDMGNIMSYYPCKCGFTQSQFKLMVETILQSQIRHF